MPPGFVNIEWLNANSQRAYPLSTAASRKDTTGTITLPDSFIVALYFPVHAGVDVEPDKFFLQAVGIFPTGFYVALAYDDGSSTPPVVATANIASALHTENRSYLLAGRDDFADSEGVITIGKLDEIDALPSGQYVFAPAAGMLEPDAIRPMIRGISAIILVNGSDRSVPLVGDIELVAGSNIRLTTSGTSGNNARIVINAISGEGLNDTCECVDDTVGPCIKTINGIPPAPDGDFKFAGDACLQINGIANGLSLTDSCSSPCCGCAELDALRTQLNRFGDAKATLEGYVNRLGAEVTQMSLVVLGSRLGDNTCPTE